MGRRDRTALALLVLALSLNSILPFCSAAYNTKQQQQQNPAKKGRSPPSIDIGRSSSAVFPLYGNVYPHGLYFVSIGIGDPPKPYFLDVDTGSDLTWLQCDAPCISCFKGPHPLYKPTKDKLVSCEHPICVSLQSTTTHQSSQHHHLHGCESPDDQCDYEVEYADQGSSRGVLISDAFSIRFVNGSLLRPHLAFGCGYDQQMHVANAPSPTDGVLGLGLGRSGIMSQLREQGLARNVMGHCLSRRGGGFLFFGDDLVPHSAVTWTPMTRRGPRKNYSPEPANLFFGKQLVAKDFQVVFDSGSSYTYFSSRPYQAFLHMVMKDLSGKPLEEAFEDRTLPLCWKGPKPLKSISDVKRYFKHLTLSFPRGKRGAQLEIPPDGYLIITKYGNVCLGVLNGTEVGLDDLNVVGDISVQDLMVVYDNEKERIGWTGANCDRLPKFGTAPLTDSDDGYKEGFGQHHLAGMGGVLTGELEFPVSYTVHQPFDHV